MDKIKATQKNIRFLGAKPYATHWEICSQSPGTLRSEILEQAGGYDSKFDGNSRDRRGVTLSTSYFCGQLAKEK